MWFKKLHKFYADPYWDKFQLSLKNLNSNSQSSSNIGSSNTNTTSNPNTPNNASNNSNSNINNLANTQNQRLRGLLAILNDPNYQITRQKFLIDFHYQSSLAAGQRINLSEFILKIKNWIKSIESYLNSLPKKQLLMDERFKFVTQFCSKTSDIELPGEYLIPRSTNYYIKISRFLPWYDLVEKYGSYSRRISIRGHNGKVYPFLISNEATYYYECRKEEHVMQLMRMVNTYLSKQKETASRNLHYNLPRVVSLSAEVRMIEDDFSALSLLDIYKSRKANESADLPLNHFFEALKSASNTNSSGINLVDIFKSISANYVPRMHLRDWASLTYTDATDYFSFRKTFSTQLAMYNFAEYVFCLTRLNPEQFYLSKDTGLCENIRLKFDILEQQQTSAATQPSTNNPIKLIQEFNTKQLVPFRLTPNLAEFMTIFGINGLYSSVFISIARCLSQAQYNFSWLLRAVIKDEILNFITKKVSYCLFD